MTDPLGAQSDGLRPTVDALLAELASRRDDPLDRLEYLLRNCGYLAERSGDRVDLRDNAHRSSNSDGTVRVRNWVRVVVPSPSAPRDSPPAPTTRRETTGTDENLRRHVGFGGLARIAEPADRNPVASAARRPPSRSTRASRATRSSTSRRAGSSTSPGSSPAPATCSRRAGARSSSTGPTRIPAARVSRVSWR